MHGTNTIIIIIIIIIIIFGKFVSLRSKEIVVRKLAALTQGAGSVFRARRAWLAKLQVDHHRDGGASALDRAAKQHKHKHKQTVDVRCDSLQDRQGGAKVASQSEVTLL